MKCYTVTEDAEFLMPKWLAEHVDHEKVKLSYRTRDGTSVLAGIRIGNKTVHIGDTIILGGNRLTIERGDAD